ncbi:MAG: 50S ribosomal protein L11 [Nanoarchaeota archaeon]|nr:50S ribosomal protein L11 [Nanoarchaeota archaeon]
MIVKLIIEGGDMKPNASISQKLGPMGINIGKVIQDVNKETSGFKGMKVPVELDVNPKTKAFTIHVSSPPTAELLKKELGIELASGTAKKNKVGNLAIEQVISIAKTKQANMTAASLKAAVKSTLGSCGSLGILVESKEAKETSNEVSEGKYDEEINSEKTDVSEEKKAELSNSFLQVKSKQDAELKKEEELKAAAEAAKTAAAPAAGTPAAAGATPASGKPAAGAAPAAKAEAKPAKKEAKKK